MIVKKIGNPSDWRTFIQNWIDDRETVVELVNGSSMPCVNNFTPYEYPFVVVEMNGSFGIVYRGDLT